MQLDDIKFPLEFLELEILKKSVKDISFFLKVKDYLDTSSLKEKSYFKDIKKQKIFNMFCIWFNKYQKLPTKNDLRIPIENKSFDEDIKLYLFSILEKVYTEEILYTEEAIETETIHFIKNARAIEGVIKAQIRIEKGELDAIPGELMEAINVNFDKDLGMEITDPIFIDKLNEVYHGSIISSGFHKLDTILSGGFSASTLVVISGSSGTGKCCRKDVKVTVEYYIDDSTGEIV